MYKSTTLRDFAGGWNALDDDLNLAGSYQPVLDNIHRGMDNLLSVRWGYELFANMQDGADSGETLADFAFSTVSGSREITVVRTAVVGSWDFPAVLDHGHITFAAIAVTVGGIDVNGKYGVQRVSASTFKIWAREVATSTATVSSSLFYTYDDHMLSGNIIENAYYSDHIVVMDNIGEIAKISATGTKTRLWDVSISKGLTDNPIGWVTCDFISCDVFKGQLIVCNGLDKPLQIDFSIADQVQYLVDLGTGSNANTPVCRYVKAMGRWIVFAGDAEHPNRIHISSTDTSGTFFGDAAPNDALFIDVNYASNSPSFIIRGINKFREFVVVGFDDAIVLLQLGIFDTATPANHTPSINDVIARHGVIAHKSMSFLGFDLIMADPVGVPSLAKSMYDSSVVPSRQSAVIAPPLQRNIGRLSPATLQDKVFAVYNTHASQYMLFMPDFDDDEVLIGDNPFYIPDEFIGTGKVIVRIRDHGMEEGNIVRFIGVDDFSGIVADTYINIEHTVAGVLNEDYVLIEVDTVSTSGSAGGGGSSVSIVRVFTDTTGYVFTYNKSLKVKAWSRYRNLRFNCGCTSVYGRVFLSSDHRVWRMGNQFEPIYADKYNDYDAIWAASTDYAVGDKEYDSVTNETYTCLVAHTSSGGVSFSADRTDNPTYWELYLGEDINFAMETPWADFNERTKLKVLDYFGMDARGEGRITVNLFADYFYRNKMDGTLTPLLSMDMVGGDTGGFGAGSQSMGSGRVATRQRLWPFPARGKLLKVRLEGATKNKLKIVSMQFEYRLGGIYR